MTGHSAEDAADLFERAFEAHKADLPALTIECARAFLAVEAEDAAFVRLAWLFLGIALGELARYDEAEQAFERAIALSEKANLRRIAWSNLGHARKQRGDFQGAAHAYAQAVAADPSHAGGHVYLGALFARQGRFDEAGAVYSRGIGLAETGEIGELVLNLGLLRRGQGRYAEARDVLRRALEIDPDLPEAEAALRDVEACLEPA